MSKQLRELQARKATLVKDARALTDIAAAEERDMTDEELAAFNALKAKIEAASAAIDREAALIAARAGATRRELVVGTALVSGALLVGCGPGDLLAIGAKTEVGAFGPFIRIAADGAVVLAMPSTAASPGARSA